MRLFQPEEPLYKIHMRMAYDAFLGHVALAFLGFFGQDVTFEGLLVSDLAGAGDFKPLLGTRVRFDLWHFECFTCESLLADSHRRTTYGAIWGCKSIKKTAQTAVFLNFFDAPVRLPALRTML
jgi:hypothetical protein